MIAIDSQVLIWAVKQKSDDRQEMIDRALAFVAQIEKHGEQIMIPSMVASEFIVKYDEAARTTALELLARRFYIAPFDASAAKWAARLFQDKEEWKLAREKANSTRQWVKADIAILATAIAHGATALYAEDKPLLSTAEVLKDRIPIPVQTLPLPPRTRQQNLRGFSF